MEDEIIVITAEGYKLSEHSQWMGRMITKRLSEGYVLVGDVKINTTAVANGRGVDMVHFTLTQTMRKNVVKLSHGIQS